MPLLPWAAALATALAVTLVGCTAQQPASTNQAASAKKEPIKIGMIVSLKGSYAGLGDPEKKTMEMEVKRINDAGGVNGRPVEVIYEDDGTDNTMAVTAATKLIEQDKVIAIIGSTGTGQSMAIRDLIDRAGIAQVSMAGGNAITGSFDPLVFQTPWSNALVVPFEFEYMKNHGIKKIGVISDSGGFGKDGIVDPDDNVPDNGFLSLNCGTPTAVALSSLQARPTTTSPVVPVALVGASAAALIGVVTLIRRNRKKTA